MIDENGEQLGILPPFEALKLARERGLDLVEVSPTAVPPVCRIQDYGKFLYEKETVSYTHLPLGYLANVARGISSRRDYSVRAERRTGGEIGVLIDAFNEMLMQIEMQERARQASEDRLRESEERYAIAARGSSDGLWDWRMETGEVYFSARMNAMVGEPEAERWGSPKDLFDTIHPSDRERVHAEFGAFRASQRAAFEIECRMRHRRGGYLWVLARGTAVRDENGRIVRAAGSVNDITQRKTTDPITGLRNRLSFLDQLQAAAEAAQRDARRFAVLILSLDHFRMVNDSLGHPASEELLAQVAGRLRSMAVSYTHLDVYKRQL